LRIVLILFLQNRRRVPSLAPREALGARATDALQETHLAASQRCAERFAEIPASSRTSFFFAALRCSMH
jgi:hypothetical protein